MFIKYRGLFSYELGWIDRPVEKTTRLKVNTGYRLVGLTVSIKNWQL